MYLAAYIYIYILIMDQTRKQETWISNLLEFLMIDKNMMPDISSDQTALKVTVKLKNLVQMEWGGGVERCL